MSNNIDNILIIANMLSKTLGKLTQITVSDTHKYLFAENVIDDEAAVGQEISDNEKYFLIDSDLSQLPFVVNYKSLSSNLQKLRSSTLFFKDDNGKIEYMLSITTNVDELLYVREIIDVFVNGSPASPNSASVDSIPKLNLSIHDIIDNVIAEGQKRYNTVVQRMTKPEKESLIREMHSRGAFLIKGAVPEVAAKLNYSEATIYRYLQKLEVK